MKKIFFAIIIISSSFSCENSSERIYPASIGGPGHIMLIMENDRWKGEAGDTIRAILAKDYEVLPQSEPLFNISQIPSNALTKVLNRNRNMLFVKISSKYKKPEVLIARDKNAKPQIIITVKATDEKEFIEIFNKHANEIVSSFENADRERLIKAYSGKLLNKSVNQQLIKNHQIDICIPKSFNLDVDSSNFVWISQETQISSQGILIWHYPYTDTNQFLSDNLLNKRDSITKKYVPGPADSSYMATERIIPPVFNEFIHNNNYTAELRGLWKVDGAKGVFMGGPFISFSTVDQKRNRIVTVDGFVYGGKKKKRELLRQLEAILYTMKIVE